MKKLVEAQIKHMRLIIGKTITGTLAQLIFLRKAAIIAFNAGIQDKREKTISNTHRFLLLIPPRVLSQISLRLDSLYPYVMLVFPVPSHEQP
ncbi:hypothetical protein ACVW2L_001004 [Mucilaginibacter sp. HD30]